MRPPVAQEPDLGSTPSADVEAAETHAAPALVRVHVATDPTGAAVLLEDGSAACSPTPCAIEATPGATLVLRAKLGKRRGRTAITPTDEETVLIQLEAPKRAKPSPRSAEAPHRERERPVRSSDLKVPEWAQ
jgi:hypothetical protein